MDENGFAGSDTTSVNFKAPEEYSAQKQNDIHEYINSADPEIREAAQEYRDNKQAEFKRFDLSVVSEKEAAQLKELLGEDYTGYMHRIDKNGF